MERCQSVNAPSELYVYQLKTALALHMYSLNFPDRKYIAMCLLLIGISTQIHFYCYKFPIEP